MEKLVLEVIHLLKKK